jgi:hypothetical protein
MRITQEALSPGEVRARWPIFSAAQLAILEEAERLGLKVLIVEVLRTPVGNYLQRIVPLAYKEERRP